MSFFEWTDDLSLGVSNIDDQHKQIVAAMNLLHEKNEKNASKDELLASFQELGAITVKHFADEEKFMDSFEFTDVKVHKIIHKQLLDKFGAHLAEFEAGDGAVSVFK